MLSDKEKVKLYEGIFQRLYINRNLSLDVDRMKEILDAIDFLARFDYDKQKGIPQQKLIALSI